MKKYLVQIEFRYTQAPDKWDREYNNRIITIGVFDDFKTACKKGNDLLIKLENRFPLHVYPDGTIAKKERFSKNGGCFNSRNTLVTNLAYLKTPFEFFAKIVTLNHDSIDETIDEILVKRKEYIENKKTKI